MKGQKRILSGIAAAGAMLAVILDSKTALQGAIEGVQLCIQAVIPSLFLFFILSGVINSAFLGQRISVFRPLGKLCKIPPGAESILLLSFLSGYPVGAQLIAAACREDRLSRRTACRMLGFCNNAGPAFLFGLLSPLFSESHTVWILWAIQIISAIIVGVLLPGEKENCCRLPKTPVPSLSSALQNAVKNMALVCGWVILLRVVLAFCNRWFLWLFPPGVQVLFAGMLELTNGCMQLKTVPAESARFVLAGIMLASGGLCVGMQTLSVVKEIGSGYYFPGKVLQSMLAWILSILVSPLLFQDTAVPKTVLLIPPILVIILLCILIRKKVVAFEGGMLYNQSNQSAKGAEYAVSKENHTRLLLLSARHSSR